MNEETKVDVWDDFKEHFPGIGSGDGVRGFRLMEQVLLWASRWPKHVWTQVVSDALGTTSLLVFIKQSNKGIMVDNQPTVELVVIPQNANTATVMTIARPKDTVGILEAILDE